MSYSLSKQQAKKLVLNSQRILSPTKTGRAIDATQAAIEHLSYIQIDTISVIARAHHHTLWSRNPRYQPKQLDQLLAERKVFEYWSHAAAYLPMQDYRFGIPRMQYEKQSPGHWHKRNSKIIRQVLSRIKTEGPLMAKDFEDTSTTKRAVWELKPAKYALEQLFMEGELMTTRRQGFSKVYDLTERVLPPEVNTSSPSEQEFAHYLITSYLRTHGLGQVQEFCHLRKGWRPKVQKVIDQMLEAQEIIQITVGKSKASTNWLALPEYLEVLGQPLQKSKARILSPFDNMVIQRSRIQQLFDFDYQIECYVPAPKRKYGYFSLPILWQGNLVARADCKAHRPTKLFEVRNLALESNCKKIELLAQSLSKELKAFAKFNQCEQIKIQCCNDKTLKHILSKALKPITATQ